MGLREIKRRASRHALINRDTFSAGQKVTVTHGANSVEPVMESTDVRIAHLEHTLYDVHTRLAQTEDNYISLNAKYQVSNEALLRFNQVCNSSYSYEAC